MHRCHRRAGDAMRMRSIARGSCSAGTSRCKRARASQSQTGPLTARPRSQSTRTKRRPKASLAALCFAGGKSREQARTGQNKQCENQGRRHWCRQATPISSRLVPQTSSLPHPHPRPGSCPRPFRCASRTGAPQPSCSLFCRLTHRPASLAHDIEGPRPCRACRIPPPTTAAAPFLHNGFRCLLCGQLARELAFKLAANIAVPSI